MNVYLTLTELSFLRRLIEENPYYGVGWPSIAEQRRLLAKLDEQLKYAP